MNNTLHRSSLCFLFPAMISCHPFKHGCNVLFACSRITINIRHANKKHWRYLPRRDIPRYEIVYTQVTQERERVSNSVLFSHNKMSRFLWWPLCSSCFSIDARGGKNLKEALHWKASPKEGIDESWFVQESSFSGFLMKGVKEGAKGDYFCRVDFEKSPTRNRRIRLHVIGKQVLPSSFP